MRAVVVTAFGGPDVLKWEDVAEPVAGDGQVLVRVEVAEINFVETQLRRGFSPGPPLPEVPFVPGGGVAGTVAEVGGGVDASWVGRRVVTRTVDGRGGNAEFAVADVEFLVPVPEGLGMPEAAALLNDGQTALALFERAAVKPGEWVLVEAAAGGLGSLLVQLAHGAGARVVGAASSSAKLDVARELGAEAVVDYSRDGWADAVRAATGGRGPDVVFDGVGGAIGRAAFEVTAGGGRFSIHGVSSGEMTTVDPAEAAERGVTVIGIDQLFALAGAADARDRVARVLADAAAGRLRPAIGRTFPLADAAGAHAAMEARSVPGKTLLVV
ncbi:zinc-binding dehydrogenase [Actinomadura rayongensis]|uniref:Zinc-binding dehydrogenase n=1 Tax=Actinomadura rayongensis TaxID=1429076 RepID=A0A6I4W763_9ACTN|nr:zinc-binding dehydrogenase [Actinomadura rayongensis]MXQ66589.1 zinc-binding dehydrogenase [Actinomadura rayongensis]